ncbi:MAG: FixH family protein [Pontibacterium sp.]
MNDKNTVIAPWYKQPWLWFILAPLIAVFIYGTSFLYLSIITHDGVVKEDYFKIAKAFHLDPTRVKNTEALGLKGEMQFDFVTGDIRLALQGEPSAMPDTLYLDIIHPAHRKYDRALNLRKITDGQYVASLTSPIVGIRYLALTPRVTDAEWALHAKINTLPDTEEIDNENNSEVKKAPRVAATEPALSRYTVSFTPNR